MEKSRAALTKELREAFATFDEDKSGTLTVNELTGVFTRPGGGNPMDDAEARNFILRLDTDGDGVLSMQEFVDAMLVMNGFAVRSPVRHGKWFVLHSSYLLTIKYEEQVDIHAEFLKDHPNGGERTAGLVAVRLSDSQVKAQHGRIRCEPCPSHTLRV